MVFQSSFSLNRGRWWSSGRLSCNCKAFIVEHGSSFEYFIVQI